MDSFKCSVRVHQDNHSEEMLIISDRYPIQIGSIVMFKRPTRNSKFKKNAHCGQQPLLLVLQVTSRQKTTVCL